MRSINPASAPAGSPTLFPTLNPNSWDAPQRGAVGVLASYGNSIAIDLNLKPNFTHATTENTTLAAPTNTPVPGQSGFIVFTQGNTPYSIAFNTVWNLPNGLPAMNVANSSWVMYYTVLTSTWVDCYIRAKA